MESGRLVKHGVGNKIGIPLDYCKVLCYNNTSFCLEVFPLAGKKSSAEKRHAQSEVRRLHNKAIKSECRTIAKQFVAAVQKKDQAVAQDKLRMLVSKLDSARSKGVLTRNAVSRKKSRMMKLFNVSFAAAAN